MLDMHKNEEDIKNLLANYDAGLKADPDYIIKKIVDAEEISKSEKILFLNQFKKSMLQKTAENIPGADNLTPEFVDKYEKDLEKFETADSSYEAARKTENKYSDIARGCESLSDSFWYIRSKIGNEAANTVVTSLDRVILQCIEQGNVKAFDDFVANSPLQKTDTSTFRFRLQHMTTYDINLVNKYYSNRQEFMQEWGQKFTERQQAGREAYKTEIDVKRDYLKVPDVERKEAVILSVVNYQMFLPQDYAAYRNFLDKIDGKQGLKWNAEIRKSFVDEVYGFIEKRLAEGNIQEPSVLYEGKVPEALANFAASAKKCIAEKRSLSEMQLPKSEEENLILRFGHRPNKYDLSVMKSALEISNICKQIIKKQAEENVGGKSDNSGQDDKATESSESRKNDFRCTNSR